MDSVTQLRRLGLFDARVPRYTSYPTANTFSTAIGPADMRNWISAIPEGDSVSLYIHIPFCRRLCWFCACRTQGTATAAPVRGYLDIVARELEMIAEVLPSGVTLSRLHWGGGTPTLLEPAMITELAARIADVAPFAEGAEFSVEIDPNEFDAARLDAMVQAGMNRASIGVQDFDPEIQAIIGRPQTFEVTKAAIDMLRDAGIPSLNLDILYGLPHQTERRISDSVQKVLSLGPDRVALYGYAHVPWMARRQSMIPSDSLPVPEARYGLYEVARKLFTWDGFKEVGIDHFARPTDSLYKALEDGSLKRNFQGYTDDPATVLIGLGASAISRFPQGFAQNNPATSGYHGSITAGEFATTRGHLFSREDKIREAMIGALMCDFAIDFEALGATLDEPPAALAGRLDGIDDAFPEMLAHTTSGIEIRPSGRPLTRMIARYLDQYAAGTQGKVHSSAI